MEIHGDFDFNVIVSQKSRQRCTIEYAEQEYKVQSSHRLHKDCGSVPCNSIDMNRCTDRAPPSMMLSANIDLAYSPRL